MLVKKQTIGCYTATTKAGPCAKAHRVEVRRGQAESAERARKCTVWKCGAARQAEPSGTRKCTGWKCGAVQAGANAQESAPAWEGGRGLRRGGDRHGLPLFEFSGFVAVEL